MPPARAETSNLGERTVVKWGAITFGIGMALVILEIVMASRKKEGVTVTDRKRIVGMFWVIVVLTGLVMVLVWLA